MELKEILHEKQHYIEKLLKDFLPKDVSKYSNILVDAMEYSLLVGGKRLRPIFMWEAFNICKGESNHLDGFMAAMEMIHTYSLIHDDLPAMDDDDLRRGNPTCHIKYGEDMAILAGDALLNNAFEIMINEACVSDGNENVLKAAKEIGKAASIHGMIGGQVADIKFEDQDIDINIINYIHKNKTSALIEASLVSGALLANGTEEEVESFRKLGNLIGLAFQIQDDILDVNGNIEELGKPINSDEKNKKKTYVDIVGIEESSKMVDDLLNESLEIIHKLSKYNQSFLALIINSLRNRKY